MPKVEHAVTVDIMSESFDVALQQFSSLGQGDATPRIFRCVRRRRAMQPLKEATDRFGDDIDIDDGRVKGRCAGEPWNDGPGPWKTIACPSDSDWFRNPQRELCGQLGQPALLVVRQRRRGRPAG